MHRFHLILSILFVFAVILTFSYNFAQKQSFKTFFSLRLTDSFRHASSRRLTCVTVDCCFDSYMQLLKGQNFSVKYFLFEPNPPIPIEEVEPHCRKHLIPHPMPARISKPVRACFAHQHVTERNRRIVRECLYVVKKLFDEHDIPLIITSGSLIGSWRYHGIIPYDDDFDFLIPRKKKGKAKELLAKLCQEDERFMCLLKQFRHLQLHIGCTCKKKCASFMDFFLFLLDDEALHTTFSRRIFPKSAIFPLIKRPLEGKLFDAVRDYNQMYRLEYKGYAIDECSSYDHRDRLRFSGCKRVNCSDLNSFLPFVVTSSNSFRRLEMLVNSSHIQSLYLSDVQIDEGDYGID